MTDEFDFNNPDGVKFHLYGKITSKHVTNSNVHMGFIDLDMTCFEMYLNAHVIIPSSWNMHLTCTKLSTDPAPYEPSHSKANTLLNPMHRIL